MKDFDVLIPVRDFDWEGRNLEKESVHATVLAKSLAQNLDLVGRPQTFDFFTRDGVRATFGFTGSRDYDNNNTLLYIRESLLKKYLKSEKLALIWAIWGERGYKSGSSDREWSPSNYPEPPYKVFQTVKRM